MTTATLGTLMYDRTMELAVRHSAFGNTRQAKLDHVRIDARESDGAKADPKLLKLMKDLIDSPELEAIRQHDGETGALCRTYGHSSKLRPGMYIIPDALIGKMQAIMVERAMIRAELVSQAVEMYPTHVAEASAKLGVVHNPQDYISVEAFANRFSVTWQWAKVEVPSKLQQLHPELWESEESKQAAIRERLAEEMQAAARETIADLVAHFRSVLEPGKDGKRKRFYDTTVTTLQEFCDLFTFKNVTGDDALGAIVAEMRGLVTGLDPDAFREKQADGYRRTIHDELQKFEAALEPLVTVERTRRIRIDRPHDTAAA